MERKHGVELKQLDDDGTGLARIATLNVVDADGDVTLPGAFGEQHAKLLPAHNWGSVPLGKARIFEDGDDALAEFKLNLDLAPAREWHSALKFDMADGRPLQEWSYGFTIGEESSGEHDGQQVRFLKALTVHEVSPVVVGAGVGTGTIVVKDGKRGTPTHSTPTNTGVWDGPANVRRVRQDEDAAYYNRIFAWRDPDGEVGVKSTWKFIHHFVDAGGNAAAASVRAAVTGIAVLNGARGGTTIADADRRGVWNHLARHLRDADQEPPELRAADACGVKLIEQIQLAVWDAQAVAQRIAEVSAERSERGRHLSDDALAGARGLKAALDEMQAAAAALEANIESGAGAPLVAGRLLAQFEAKRARIKLPT